MDYLNRPKRGGKRKYETAAQLQKGVDDYFGSISYLQEVLDADGNPITTNNGKKAVQLKYAVPPSHEGLCMFLGISHTTWDTYRASELFHDICEDAVLRVKAWRVEETSIRDKTNGLQFLLSNDSNMASKTEVNVRQDLTMDERKKILDSLRQMEGDDDPEGSN